MSDIKRPRPPSDRGICPVCRQDQALVMTGADAGTLRSHGKPTCPGTRQAPKAAETPPLVAALTPPSEPAPSPGEPVAPASLPPVGSVVRVGSPDSEPGRVVRHVGGSFTLRWEDGEEGGGYLPADIVPDLEAPAAEVAAQPPSEPTPAIGLLPGGPVVASVRVVPVEPDELPEGVARLGLPVERREDDRAADQWRAAALRALLPDGAELAQTATGWTLSWDGATRPAACLSDLVCDLMADASPPSVSTAAPDCEAQRRRIAVLEGQLDSSREEVGQLRARLAVATSPHRAAPSQPEVALRAALDLIAALRP